MELNRKILKTKNLTGLIKCTKFNLNHKERIKRCCLLQKYSIVNTLFIIFFNNHLNDSEYYWNCLTTKDSVKDKKVNLKDKKIKLVKHLLTFISYGDFTRMTDISDSTIGLK